MIRRNSIFVIVLILVFGFLFNCSKDNNPVGDDDSDHDHAEAVGLIISSSGLELVRGEEIEKGFSEEVARKEADRCLQCGLICYNQTTDLQPQGIEEAPA